MRENYRCSEACCRVHFTKLHEMALSLSRPSHCYLFWWCFAILREKLIQPQVAGILKAKTFTRIQPTCTHIHAYVNVNAGSRCFQAKILPSISTYYSFCSQLITRQSLRASFPFNSLLIRPRSILSNGHCRLFVLSLQSHFSAVFTFFIFFFSFFTCSKTCK